MRTFIAAVVSGLVAVIITAAIAPAFATSGPFDDIDSNVHAGAIVMLAEAGITVGCEEHLYCPDEQVTRAQVAVMIDRVFAETDVPSDSIFVDVPAGAWYAQAVGRDVARGSLEVTGASFGPETAVTRAEAVTMLVQAFYPGEATSAVGLFADVPVNADHVGEIEEAYRLGITRGCGSGLFCPSTPVRRDEMATLLARALTAQDHNRGFDRPGASGDRIHVVYIEPADGGDKRIDTTFDTSIAAVQRWFGDQTDGRQLLFDMTIDRKVDITFLRLGSTDAQVADSNSGVMFYRIVNELTKAGFDRPDRLYVFVYGGSGGDTCGRGQSGVSGLFLHGSECAPELPLAKHVTQPGYAEFVLIHEMLHSLGLVADCAPHSFDAGPGHVNDDPHDLMWSGRNGQDPWRLPPTLDVGRDDYYMAGIPGCPDLADSPYLTTRP